MMENKTNPSVSESPAVTGERSGPEFLVRFYEPRDRAAVRRICCETGFLGNPIDPLFEDREIFADYLTSYYTDAEPESTLVVEVGGEVKGYLTGSRRPWWCLVYRLQQNPRLFVRAIWRYFTRPYGEATRRYVQWLLRQASREAPHTPRGIPHFHINLLPEARSVPHTRALIDRFLEYLVSRGERSVFGQMTTFDKRRGVRMFERYGFRVVDQVEVTKYRHLHDAPVFLFTVVKDLAENKSLYGRDLWSKERAVEMRAPDRSKFGSARS